MPWFIDHAETITDRNIERIAALGGGIAVQHRMAFQGEYFVERYGAKAAEATPPIAAHAGGRAAGGGGHGRHPGRLLQSLGLARLAGDRPDRRRDWRSIPRPTGWTGETALRLWTERNAWFSSETGKKGQIKAGQLADLAVLDRDYFAVPDAEIAEHHLGPDAARRRSRCTVRATSRASPRRLPPAMPDWSPVNRFGGYQHAAAGRGAARPWRRPAAAAAPARCTGTTTAAPPPRRCARRTSLASGARWAAPAGWSDPCQAIGSRAPAPI